MFLAAVGVALNVQNPLKKKTFSEALSYINASEFELDTALNKSAKADKVTWSQYWFDLYSKAGKVSAPATPGRGVFMLCLLMALVGWFVAPATWWGGIVLAPLGMFAARTGLRAEASKRVRTMEKQLPALLAGIRANLSSGATAQQAIIAVADDVPAPLGDELKALRRDIDVNISLEVALRDLAARVPSREMQFLVSSIEISVRVGADLDPQIQTIEGIVRQRYRVRGMIRSAVAQAKPTMLLAYTVVPGMLIYSFGNPDNKKFWLDMNGVGPIVLGAVAALYVTCLVIVRTMVKGVENT
ncbi:MAG: type II secretion system F family protein [Propionicimonas sp.]